ERAHQLTALRDEPERVLEAQGSGRDQRRVFAETMPGREHGLERIACDRLERFEACDLVRQQRGLRIACQVQLAARIAEARLAHVVAEDSARALIYFSSSRKFLDDIPAHPDVLRALAGKDDENFPSSHGASGPWGLRNGRTEYARRRGRLKRRRHRQALPRAAPSTTRRSAGSRR